MEFFSTGFVAQKLKAWGYQVLEGQEIIDAGSRVMIPDEEALDFEYGRTLQEGIDEKDIAPAKGGFTGVVGILKGRQAGPTVAFRFDIDCNEVMESHETAHRPAKEGFVSCHDGYAHMCGHDVHTSIGLLLAVYFAENREKIKGTVKIIFQPGEESLGGALPMVNKGVVDDVDYLLGAHVGVGLPKVGQIALSVNHVLATSHYEVWYKGKPSHAAVCPQAGKNAMLGACAAVTNIHAISRHSKGASRINTGILRSGESWNVVPDEAYFRLETRGDTTEIDQYLIDRAKQIIDGAARMYDLKATVKPAGSVPSGKNSPELIELGKAAAQTLDSVTLVGETPLNAFEDFTVMMDRVQKKGGKAMYMVFGTPIHGGHHSSTFDIDENVIPTGATFMAGLYDRIVCRH